MQLIADRTVEAVYREIELSVCGSPFGISHLAEGIIAALIIDPTIRRENMVQVGARRRLLVKPTLRPGVFAVIAVAFLCTTASTLILPQIICIGWRSTRTVGIHVPHYAIAFVIGTPIGIPNLTIRNGSMAFDDIMQSDFQLIASQSVS